MHGTVLHLHYGIARLDVIPGTGYASMATPANLFEMDFRLSILSVTQSSQPSSNNNNHLVYMPIKSPAMVLMRSGTVTASSRFARLTLCRPVRGVVRLRAL